MAHISEHMGWTYSCKYLQIQFVPSHLHNPRPRANCITTLTTAIPRPPPMYLFVNFESEARFAASECFGIAVLWTQGAAWEYLS